MPPCSRGDWVSASDIGTYAFCARAYALGKVQKVYPRKAGQQRLRCGVSEHGRHGRRYALQRFLRRLGRMLLLAAILFAVAWFAWGCTELPRGREADPLLGLGVAATFSLLLLVTSRMLARQTGLRGGGRVLASDTGQGGVKRLRDPGTCLSGRPDYLLEERQRLRRVVVPVELKPTRRGSRLYESDEMQLTVYLLLVAAAYPGRGARRGYVRYRDHTFPVRLTAKRKRRCLAFRDAVQATRRAGDAARSHREPGRCARCSFREVCGQALA